MAVKFNPFSGQLQIDEKGSGGASYIDGEVATYNDLPLDGTAALNSAWLVRSASGVWPVSRKQAGIYIRTATGGVSRDADFTYAGTMPDVFSDAVLTIYDEASTTRTGQFNLGSVTAGQNRVLTWPDGNGTIARTSDIPSTFAASAVTSGVLDNARINFAAPSAIGSTTASSGAFTTLSANNGTLTAASAPVLDLAQTWNNAAAAFTGIRLNVTNTASANTSDLLNLQIGGTTQFRIRGSTLFLGEFTLSGLYTPSPSYIGSTGALMCATQFAVGNNLDTILIRDGAAGTLAQRNGTNPQTFRIYNTFTDASNYERGFMRWSSNVLQIGTEKGGTGSARALEFQTDGTTRVTIGTGGTATFTNTVTANGTSNGFETSSAPNGASPVRFSADSGNVVIQTALNPGITEIRGTTATNPQTVRIFNTRTSSTNFERLNIRWASNECIIDAEAGSGGGTLRGIKIGSATSSLLGFYGATPAAQPAAVADATDAATTQARLNDLLAAMRSLGLIAT